MFSLYTILKNQTYGKVRKQSSHHVNEVHVWCHSSQSRAQGTLRCGRESSSEAGRKESRILGTGYNR